MERRTLREAKCIALEQEHVHRVYEKTAHHFTDVHYKAWPRVHAFLQSLEFGSLVADVGCGSGRYLHINPSIYKLGSDRSQGLVEIARHGDHEVMVCDNLHLPYRDNSFDAVISIAVIHHFTTAKRRALAVKELARVLRPGGKVMIYVWAMEQEKRKFNCQDVLVPWHFKPRLKPESNGHIPLKEQPGDLLQAQACIHKDVTISSNRFMRLPWSSTKRTKATSDEKLTTSDNQAKFPMKKATSTHFPRFVLPFRGLFNRKKSQGLEPVTHSNPHDKTTAKLKDEVYKKLIEQIMREDQEIFRLHRPLLQHSLSAPEEDGFAVREFPLSSQPLLVKQTSLDSAIKSLEHISLGRDHCQVANQKTVALDNGKPDKPSLGSVDSENLRSCSSSSSSSSQATTNMPESYDSVLEAEEDDELEKAIALSSKLAQIQEHILQCQCSSSQPSSSLQSTLSEESLASSESSDSERDWAQMTAKAIESVQSQMSQVEQEQADFISGTSSAGNTSSPPRTPTSSGSISSGSSGSSKDLEDFFQLLKLGGMDANGLSADHVEESVLHGMGSTDDEAAQESTLGKLCRQDSVNPDATAAEEPSFHDAYKRFYHVFREQELVELVQQHVDCLHILESFYDHANWCVIAEKVNVWTI